MLFSDCYEVNNLKIFKQGRFFGVLNTATKAILIEPEYREITFFTFYLRGDEIFCIVRKDSKWAIANSKGDFLTPFKFSKIFIQRQRVKYDGKWGFIDAIGKEIVHCIYDNLDEYANGAFYFYRGGVKGYLNRRGEELINYKEVE